MTDATLSPQEQPNDALALDNIYGAGNIAKFLSFKVRTIYYFLELKRSGKSDVPIYKKPGLGIYASKKTLLAYFKSGR